MPTEISEANLKIDLHSVLDRVARGEEILVKRSEGSAIRLVNMESQTTPAASQHDFDKALAEMHAFRKAHSLNGLSIRELIDEGRKF